MRVNNINESAGVELFPDGGKLVARDVSDELKTNVTHGKKAPEMIKKLKEPSPSKKKTVKAAVGYLKSKGKLGDISKEFDIDPKPDLTFRGDGSVVVTPDNGKSSYKIPSDSLEKFESRKRNIKEHESPVRPIDAYSVLYRACLDAYQNGIVTELNETNEGFHAVVWMEEAERIGAETFDAEGAAIALDTSIAIVEAANAYITQNNNGDMLIDVTRDPYRFKESQTSAEFQKMAPGKIIGMNIQTGSKHAMGKKDKYNKLGERTNHSLRELRNLKENASAISDPVEYCREMRNLINSAESGAINANEALSNATALSEEIMYVENPDDTVNDYVGEILDTIETFGSSQISEILGNISTILTGLESYLGV